MKINEVEALVNITKKNIRFYEEPYTNIEEAVEAIKNFKLKEAGSSFEFIILDIKEAQLMSWYHHNRKVIELEKGLTEEEKNHCFSPWVKEHMDNLQTYLKEKEKEEDKER